MAVLSARAYVSRSLHLVAVNEIGGN